MTPVPLPAGRGRVSATAPEATVEPVTDASALAGLAATWEELVADSDADPLFLGWDWVTTWWRHLAGARRLRVALVRDAGGEPIAIAPLALRAADPRRVPPFSCLEPLGAGAAGADHLDLIVRRGRADQALPALATHLAGAGRVLSLARVRPAGHLDALAALLADAGWGADRAADEPCPYVPLAGRTFDEYLATLGAEHRYAFRRKLRRLRARGALELRLVADEAERRAALAALFALHERRWRGRGEPGAFATPALRAFHDELTARALAGGWLRLLTLRLDGRVAAALYGLRRGPRFYFYQAGFDPDLAAHGAGVVTMGLAIERAFAEGADEFDLLHGDERYKFHWTDRARPLARIELFPPPPRGWLYRGTLRLTRRARAAARACLPARWRTSHVAQAD